MEQICDLSIILTSSPAGVPPKVAASLEVRCELLNLIHGGEVFVDPLKQGELNDLRWYLEEYWQWPYEGFLERGQQIEALLPQVGERLYKAVFGRSEANSVFQAWRLQSEAQHQISIISDLPAILNLPWELLHDGQSFLAVDSKKHPPASIIRRLAQKARSVSSFPFELPLRILLVTARPEDKNIGFTDSRSIARELVAETQDQVEEGNIEVEFLRPPTFEKLRARLNDRTRPVHVFHFDGHGMFDEKNEKQGMLAFEKDGEQLDLVKASDIRNALQQSGVRLVVLTACQSAMINVDDALSSVAAQLLQSDGGVDAVVAMSASILVVSAARYTEAFYRALAGGLSAQIAHERAQYLLYENPLRHPHRRRLDEVGISVKMQDWWVPHFYQQRPLVLQPITPVDQPGQQHRPLSFPLLSEVPAKPRYDFIGRARELLQIERALLRQKPVILHGFGGMGKTALACEAANWFIQTKMYDGACFVSFEHGGDAVLLLSKLGKYLEINNDSYDPNDVLAALEQLETLLEQRRFLVIADNVESVLPGGNAPLTVDRRKELYYVLRQLRRKGAGILLTSRGKVFEDNQLAPEGQVEYLTLSGLHPEDAYAVASRLLNDLGIDPAHAPYAELRDLLAQLDYHPLAIQLVLPMLRELPLSKIKADFTTLLPRFVDDTLTGRNRSLLASLDYSLRWLNKEQQALLSSFVVFEGGAYEDTFLWVTEIPQDQWIWLRSVLEQAGLLIVERTPAPFLLFHPTLIPFLRSQRGMGNAVLRERFAGIYDAMAGVVWHDQGKQLFMRKLIRWEWPNLRKALFMLLEEGNLQAAAPLAEMMITFLTISGQKRESDELRKRALEKFIGKQEGESQTSVEIVSETILGEDELRSGNVPSALVRYTTLLKQIESQAKEIPGDIGSYHHRLALREVARGLLFNEQESGAEPLVRKALALLDTEAACEPEKQNLVQERAEILSDLAFVLSHSGRYQEAQEVCEEAFKIATQLSDLRLQAVVLGVRGFLALKQQDYTKAEADYIAAQNILGTLREPGAVASVWHQLGRIAQEQNDWIKAERCYRESLALNEFLGNAVNTVSSCNQLAKVAEHFCRFEEAENWYRRALERANQYPGSPLLARQLNNLTHILVSGVIAGRVAREHLAKAREYAEQSLAIKETLDVSSEIWNTLRLLATIADQEGDTAKARAYRYRERETFAAFAGNRYHIDQEHRRHIIVIAAAVSDPWARAEVEASLVEAEATGWHVAAAIHRIWAGERNWQQLVEDMDRKSALLVLRILETLEQPASMVEQLISSLPTDLRDALYDALYKALEGKKSVAFERLFDALSQEEKLEVTTVMLALKVWGEKIFATRNALAEWLQSHSAKAPASLTTLISGDQVDKSVNIASAERVILQHTLSPEISSIWQIPSPRNPFFTGREVILEHIHDTFRTAPTRPQVLSGLEGIGKTHIALEYAHRYQQEYLNILWVKADSRDVLSSDVVNIAHLLELIDKEEQDLHRISNTVISWLNTHANWLLIMDNVDDLTVVRDLLASAGKGHILLTTRSQTPSRIARGISIEKMTREESMLFLFRQTNIIASEAPLESAPAKDCIPAKEIVEIMDGHPLALDLAGAYIKETGCSLSDYLSFYKKRQFERRQADLTKGRTVSTFDYTETIATTWSLSVQKVIRANPAAAELLKIFAFLHPDVIPEEIITEGASHLGSALKPVAADQEKLKVAIGELLKYSLVSCNRDTKTLTISRLVQMVLKCEMSEATQRRWAVRTVQAVNAVLHQDPESTRWQRYPLYLLHAYVCATLIKDWGIISTEST